MTKAVRDTPTEAMIEAGIQAALSDPWIKLDIDAAGLRQSGFVERIYTAMQAARPIDRENEGVPASGEKQ